jgi:hypothetical protein
MADLSLGPLVYILHSVLLDHSDGHATIILRQLKNALPVDNPQARIIIMEERLLDVPEPENRLVDLTVLNLGGKLRNKEMFEAIAAAAGLEVVGFYTQEGNPMCVVECARSCESATPRVGKDGSNGLEKSIWSTRSECVRLHFSIGMSIP